MAEFDDPAPLVKAANETYAAGYRQVDAFSPIPVHGLAQAIGFKKDRVALCVLIGGLSGATLGFNLAHWAQRISYPLNVGGRPLFSWPSWIPVTFECTILFAGFSALFSLIMLNGLPRLHHPVFEVPAFQRASLDKFFLLIKSSDPKFKSEDTRRFLEGFQPTAVAEVPNT
ncbi:MAG: DUF3341 domain-containing protein [Candidatus Sericytochromatia bacterium]|nr:DUF3341 domain-containing protein [Candidatus Sericytochromatia bacterium]